MLLNFRDRAPKRTDRGAIELLLKFLILTVGLWVDTEV
jgi:hypothetical protein